MPRHGADGSIERRRLPRWDPSWLWVLGAAPPLEIDGQTLGVFLDWLERETGWTIEIESTRRGLRDIRLSGSIEGLRPDQAPAAVLPTCGLTYELVDGVLTLRSGGG